MEKIIGVFVGLLVCVWLFNLIVPDTLKPSEQVGSIVLEKQNLHVVKFVVLQKPDGDVETFRVYENLYDSIKVNQILK